MHPINAALRRLQADAEEARNLPGDSGRELEIVMFLEPGRGDIYLIDKISGSRVQIEYEDAVMFGVTRTKWQEVK